MKTKFIKVSVKDRLPEKNKCVKVICPSGNIYEGFVTDKDIWQVYTQFEYGRIEHWIEEVPDREDEMSEFIKKVQFDIQSGLYPQGEMYDYEIEQLLNELKETT